MLFSSSVIRHEPDTRTPSMCNLDNNDHFDLYLNWISLALDFILHSVICKVGVQLLSGRSHLDSPYALMTISSGEQTVPSIPHGERDISFCLFVVNCVTGCELTIAIISAIFNHLCAVNFNGERVRLLYLNLTSRRHP